VNSVIKKIYRWTLKYNMKISVDENYVYQKWGRLRDIDSKIPTKYLFAEFKFWSKYAINRR